MNTQALTDDETKVVTFRLSESDLTALDALARQESRSRSSLLVLLVRQATRPTKESHVSFFADDYSQEKSNFTNARSFPIVDLSEGALEPFPSPSPPITYPESVEQFVHASGTLCRRVGCLNKATQGAFCQDHRMQQEN